MIVRDLLVGPKPFAEIERGLPGISTNVLTTRLNDLEKAGIVERCADAGYALTPAGEELEESVIAIGRWGAKRLGDPRPGEVITEDAIAMALRSTFRPEYADGVDVKYLLKVGEVEITARVHRGAVTVMRGAIADPDLVIEAGSAVRALLAREITPEEAVDRELVRLTGNPALFERFVAIFRI
jgi:DNA-binding HxlR family transcriptional regulator